MNQYITFGTFHLTCLCNNGTVRRGEGNRNTVRHPLLLNTIFCFGEEGL
jgi:hypothetical protein